MVRAGRNRPIGLVHCREMMANPARKRWISHLLFRDKGFLLSAPAMVWCQRGLLPTMLLGTTTGIGQFGILVLLARKGFLFAMLLGMTMRRVLFLATLHTVH